MELKVLNAFLMDMTPWLLEGNINRVSTYLLATRTCSPIGKYQTSHSPPSNVLDWVEVWCRCKHLHLRVTVMLGEVSFKLAIYFICLNRNYRLADRLIKLMEYASRPSFWTIIWKCARLSNTVKRFLPSNVFEKNNKWDKESKHALKRSTMRSSYPLITDLQ